MNLFYRLMVNCITNTLDLKLKNVVQTLEDYHQFVEPENVKFDGDGRLGLHSGELNVVRKKENKIIYDIFFENLHIHVSQSDIEKIFSIRLKKNEDIWRFKDDNGNIDFTHPVNQTYEVYVWYEVPVLDITTSVGYLYKNGNWDKYFYNAIHRFLESLQKITDRNQFNEAYGKGNNKEVTK